MQLLYEIQDRKSIVVQLEYLVHGSYRGFIDFWIPSVGGESLVMKYV